MRGTVAAAMLALALLLSATSLPVRADSEAVPSVASTATPNPETVACRAVPRSFSELEALGGTPAAGAVPPAPEPTPGLLPGGQPADAATTEAVTGVLRELLACFHAGEPLRVYGLYSDAYLRRLLARSGPPDRGSYDLLATPEKSVQEDRSVLRSVTGVRLLDGPRAGAVVVISYPTLPEGLRDKRFFFVFVREGSQWLIDDVVGEISFGVP